ncbi:MAG TPA: helix-turn-helix domain-containing protein [Acidimicrobiales bacterium]|nr:helix-turn-helix domain-containing protein [Acidimicrobiales bacterium]
MEPRQVLIVAFPDLQSLDVVGPLEVFAGADRAAETAGLEAGYRPTVASLHGGSVVTSSGLELATSRLPRRATGVDTLLLPGGTGVRQARHDAALVRWVARNAPNCRRVATVCTGAFLAAQAGLLDGRRVTTHWASAGQLADDYPALQVDPDPIYIEDGPYWSSAGVTAGIDLALALVEADLGVEIAQTVARWLVMFLHRPGGQTQFATPVWTPRAERSAVRAVQHRIETDPAADHRLPQLADAAAMSVRHFARVFRSEVGQTPGRFVEHVRLQAARRLLEETSDTLQVVAERCGLGSAETLRRSFLRHLRVTPDAYRRRFATATVAATATATATATVAAAATAPATTAADAPADRHIPTIRHARRERTAP